MTDSKPDPLGCSQQLLSVLSRPELDAFDSDQPVEKESRRAASWLAVALGRCRLFGVNPGEYDGVLPPRIAIAAAEECSSHLQEWAERARAIGQEWGKATGDSDCELEAGHLLFLRMDFWAAFVAIDEAYQACIRAKDDASTEFRHVVEPLIRDSQALDDAMQINADAICVAAETEMLENWRGLLAEPYCDTLPWWLDGTLEAALDQMRETAFGTQPRHLRPSVTHTAGMDITEQISLPRFAAGNETEMYRLPRSEAPEVEFEEDFAQAAGDPGNPDADRTALVEYLTTEVLDSLLKAAGNNPTPVWFLLDSTGKITAHTFDRLMASPPASRSLYATLPAIDQPADVSSLDRNATVHWVAALCNDRNLGEVITERWRSASP